MSWAIVWWVLTGLFVLNALRLRAHASHFRRLPAAPPGAVAAPAAGRRWQWVTAAAVEVPAAVRRAVEEYAASEGLDAVDAVPADLPAEQAMQLAGGEDPSKYRAKVLAGALSAQQALVVDEATWQRMALAGATDGLDPVAMDRVAREVKRHAPATTDLVVVRGARAAGEDPARRRALFKARLGPAAGLVLWAPLLRLALLVSGVVFYPLAGGIAAGVWCLQPALALLGTPLLPRDLAARTLLRWLLSPLDLLRALAGRWQPSGAGEGLDAESLRPVYKALLAGGLDPFFEERRPDCPMCGSTDLRPQVHAVDLVQRKPGRFVLDRCRSCRHVFQNPRLSIAGLEFYYRDCYDGMGEEQTELVFGAMGTAYQARAAMLDGAVTPRSWIDVGTGHGHFCLVARQRWPETRFDGLDMSESIEIAERRGWVAHGYRGFLVDLAPELAGRYDVVSMHHYLEHTREPLDELDAAISLLAPDGHLLIELPDPDCTWGRLLGRYWMPWFQPQHQHMMPMALLESALVERGYEVVKQDRGSAEQPVNLTAALLLLTMHVAPPPGLPWRRRPSVFASLRFALALLVAAPFFLLAFFVDRVALLWVRRRWRSNAYRVLARRAPVAAPAAN